MNFKKSIVLIGLIASTLASTAAHADISRMRGKHWLALVNNPVNGASISVVYNETGVPVVNCLNVARNQVQKTNIVVSNGKTIFYRVFQGKNCTGKTLKTSSTKPVANTSEYWYLNFYNGK